MSTLNRTIAPELIIPTELPAPAYEKVLLNNGIPVYLISGLKQDALKIELIFNAGRMHETQKLTAQLTASMLKESNLAYASKEFAEQLDFYGASFNASASYDRATINISTLGKHLEPVLGLGEEALKRPAFNKKDLDSLLSTRKQNLQVNLQKTEYLADKQFYNNLYGANHPFGYLTTLQDYDLITPESLAELHQKQYCSNNLFILVSGNIDAGVIDILNKHFGGNDWAANRTPNEADTTPQEVEQIKVIHELKDSVQSSIRIGKLLFNKAHPDHIKLSILNTVLGGYFGSRLMSNIREDKGYTYGIYSSLASIHNTGYLEISTEVGKQVCADAVREIYLELERLIHEPIPQDELQLVKNYLIGRLQVGLDGPFRFSNTLKGLFLYDLDIDYIYSFVKAIHEVTADELQALAHKYLQPDSMKEIIVG